MRRRSLIVTLSGLGAAIVLALSAAPSSAKTVWLCFPGHHPDPCAAGLSTTVYSPTLKQLGVTHPTRPAKPPIDCFYVYPTVSGETTGNSDLQVQAVEKSIALYQAARYSQYCTVYAPMYRQETLAGIGQGTPTTKPNATIGFNDVQSAFETYLRSYNHGRGFVLIGHSQGSFVLRELMSKDVDPKLEVRKRLVSAILMGGNVLVKRGSEIGGDFKHIPGCRSATQLGCVIAFSTFDQPVPTPSLFGRADGATVTPYAIAPKNLVVLCTNPAALAGGSGILDPIFPSQPFDPTSILAAGIAALGVKQPQPSTVWATEPGAFSAQCSSANDANVLEVHARDGAKAPVASPTPEWGLHLVDANIALGNLIAIVKKESAAFVASARVAAQPAA